MTYSILAGSTVTNTGATTISGDVGISPGIGPTPHFTGFGTVVFGSGSSVHDADVGAAGAVFDRDVAYLALDQGCTTTFAGAFKELAGEVLGPGVYCATSFHLTTGILTLSGTPSDTWIFKSASDVIITGGAAASVAGPSCNIWWRAVSSVALDAGSSLRGNILADTSITFAAGARLAGRAFARTAGVTLSDNAIAACAALGPSVAPTVSKTFNPAAIVPGGNSRLTITLTNPNATATVLTSLFTDTLPVGVVVATLPNATTTCGGAAAAAGGGSTVTLAAGSTIVPGSCAIGVDVTAAGAGAFVNTIAAGALSTPAGSNALAAGATLTAALPIPVPTLSEWALIALAALLAGAGVVALRRRTTV